MNKWKSISEVKILESIQNIEDELSAELGNFWRLIKIYPEKWQEPEYGNDGGGFWVVALAGRRVIWYNDIEEGFNISEYRQYGKIENYSCSQDQLDWTIKTLYKTVKHEDNE